MLMEFAGTQIYVVSSIKWDWSITLKEGDVREDCNSRKKIKINGK